MPSFQLKAYALLMRVLNSEIKIFTVDFNKVTKQKIIKKYNKIFLTNLMKSNISKIINL